MSGQRCCIVQLEAIHFHQLPQRDDASLTHFLHHLWSCFIPEMCPVDDWLLQKPERRVTVGPSFLLKESPYLKKSVITLGSHPFYNYFGPLGTRILPILVHYSASKQLEPQVSGPAPVDHTAASARTGAWMPLLCSPDGPSELFLPPSA